MTKSGSSFLNSINSENMLGNLCKDANVKYYE
jgi:hypothetical protein